jgi:hypothetical protein
LDLTQHRSLDFSTAPDWVVTLTPSSINFIDKDDGGASSATLNNSLLVGAASLNARSTQTHAVIRKEGGGVLVGDCFFYWRVLPVPFPLQDNTLGGLGAHFFVQFWVGDGSSASLDLGFQCLRRHRTRSGPCQLITLPLCVIRKHRDSLELGKSSLWV